MSGQVRSHAASLKSERLQRLLRYLVARGQDGATTIEMCRALDTTNPGRDISEINANFQRAGKARRIVCEYDGLTENGRKVHRYRLLREIPRYQPLTVDKSGPYLKDPEEDTCDLDRFAEAAA